MIIIPANTISGGYEVANSLRFNSGDTPELTRTPSGAGNRKTLTFSTWIKRSKLGSHVSHLFSAGTDTSGNDRRYSFYIYNDILYQDRYGSSNALTQVLRDPSAWYHIVIAIDTTQSTATDRVKVYINGGSANTFGSALFNQNDDTPFNSTLKNNVGKSAISSETSFDGYMAETVLVDGQALTPTSFGEFDEDTNIWKPKDVSGLTFGTNGFYLDFENSGSLGADVSGNGNNFTVNNLTSIDQTTDTCTNNFATLNALANYYFNGTLSEGNLKVVSSGSVESYLTGTIAVSTGKWYWEIKVTASGSNYEFIGIADKLATASNFTPYSGNSKVISYSGHDGKSIYGSTGTAYGDTYTTGDIIGVAMDLDNNKLYFSKNGVFQNSGVPTSGATGTGALAIDSSPADGVWYPQFANIHNTSSTFEANFGNPPFTISSGNTDGNGYGNFEYAVPSEYYALNSKNLSEYG
jgi:hypothetical protein